ncbi:MAG: hypothetical protein JXQ72_11210 [Anaerolineae bacterium]|nr:hypothetical protein [Anaerolineae bacterium]
MSTREEILNLLASGSIDIDEAERLLKAVSAPQPEPQPQAERAASRPDPRPAPRPVLPKSRNSGRRWLRIHVSNLETGQNRVRVNVPMGLVNFGLKVGARFTDELDGGVMQDVIQALEDPDITGTLVEVEDVEDNEHVHIFID